jgi:hypothetical protein
MACAYDGRNLPYLNNYKQAREYWERAPRWRGEDNARILDTRRKRNVTILQLTGGSIACKLYSTNVVTYHPDNTLTLMPWASVNTDEFAGRLLRGTGILPMFNRAVVKVGDKIYLAIDTIKLASTSDGYVVISTPKPFEIKKIIHTRANTVLKQYDYKAFASWVRMMDAMAAEPPAGEEYSYYPRAPVLDALLDRSRWEALLCRETGWFDRGKVLVAKTLDNVRQGLYRAHPEVYAVESLPYLTTWNDVERWKRSERT